MTTPHVREHHFNGVWRNHLEESACSHKPPVNDDLTFNLHGPILYNSKPQLVIRTLLVSWLGCQKLWPTSTSGGSPRLGKG